MCALMPQLPDPAAQLSRKQAAKTLKDMGYPVSASTLAKVASAGTGPLYQAFAGGMALYRWGDVLAWAESRLSAPARSAAEVGTSRKTKSATSVPPLLPKGATLLEAFEEWASRVAVVLCELDPGQTTSILNVTNNLLTAIESEADRGMIARRIEAKDRKRVT